MNYKEAKTLVNKLLEADLDDPNAFLRHYASPFVKLAELLKPHGFHESDEEEDTLVWTHSRFEVVVSKEDSDPIAVSWDADEKDHSGFSIVALLYNSTTSESDDYIVYSETFVKTTQEAMTTAIKARNDLLSRF